MRGNTCIFIPSFTGIPLTSPKLSNYDLFWNKHNYLVLHCREMAKTAKLSTIVGEIWHISRQFLYMEVTNYEFLLLRVLTLLNSGMLQKNCMPTYKIPDSFSYSNSTNKWALNYFFSHFTCVVFRSCCWSSINKACVVQHQCMNSFLCQTYSTWNSIIGK